MESLYSLTSVTYDGDEYVVTGQRVPVEQSFFGVAGGLTSNAIGVQLTPAAIFGLGMGTGGPAPNQLLRSMENAQVSAQDLGEKLETGLRVATAIGDIVGGDGMVGPGPLTLGVLRNISKGAASASRGLPRVGRSLSAAADITTRSTIGRSSYATRLAEGLGQQAQRDVDNLLGALRGGNMNPGIGTRALSNGFFELREANAGRVIVKQTSSTAFDVVGKFQGHVRGDAANSAIIQRLMSDYLAF